MQNDEMNTAVAANPRAGLGKVITGMVFGIMSDIMLFPTIVYTFIVMIAKYIDISRYTDISGFAFAIYTFAMCTIIFLIMTLAFGIVGIAVSKSGLKVCRDKFKGMGKAGVVTGTIAVIFCGVIIVGAITLGVLIALSVM